MVNQPIPFKQRPAAEPATATEDGGKARPAGEVGGHTVQPWEQDAVPATTSPNSKDVPPPEAGAREARPPPLSTNPGGEEGGAATGVHGAGASGSANRPPRPPVYSPQAGHEPAPRPPPSHQPTGLGTEGDRLVEAITKAIAENIGKAFHQSVAQAVRDVMPLSGRSVDAGKPAGSPSPPGSGNTGVASPRKAAPAVPATAKPAPKPAKPEATPAAQEPSGGAQPSQYGGTIEPPVGAPTPGEAAAPGDKETEGKLA